MRRIFKRHFNSSLLIFLLILILTLISYLHPIGSRHHVWEKKPVERLVEKEMAYVDGSIPHKQYIKMQDSVRNEIVRDNFNWASGSGWSSFSIGTSRYNLHDGGHLYYFILKGYENEDALFYRKNGKEYMDYTVWDYVNADYKSGEIVTRETEIKYTDDTEKEGAVMIPISKSTQILVTIILIIFSIALFIGFLCFLVYLPLKFLLLVAKGESFTDETIACLFLMSRFLLIVGFASSLIKIIFHLIFRSRIPPEITFSWYDAVMAGSQFVIAGLIVLLLAKAFLKGSQLQQDQELTV